MTVSSLSVSTQVRPPLRDNNEIQGNVLAGFNKDFQTFLFVVFAHDSNGNVTDGCREWLRGLVPRVAANDEVTRFNEEFSAYQKANGGADPDGMDRTWISVALTDGGLRALSSASAAQVNANSDLNVGAQGMVTTLHDPDPGTWLFGGSKDGTVRPDMIVTIAGDRLSDVEENSKDIVDAAGPTVQIHVEQGATLPSDRVGHEHFGFKDGVSQPQVQDYDFPDAVPAGAHLVGAGQFLVDYDKSDGQSTWMKNGSFMVYRRLAQDVAGFWSAAASAATELTLPAPQSTTSAPVVRSVSPDEFAARLMGRWRNGTPISLDATGDPGSLRASTGDAGFVFGATVSGDACPFASHVRKMNPREGFPGDDHRILRRGIPFGKPYDASEQMLKSIADSPRGLHFVCYASSYTPFVPLQSTWANTEAPGGGGLDPIIQSTGDRSDFTVCGSNGDQKNVSFKSFVTSTAAVLAFTPTISSLSRLVNNEDLILAS